MKSFIFKTAVVVLLAVFAFGFMSVKENKSACAAVCPYCLGCEADWYSVAVEFVQMGADMIISWFQNALRMIQQFFIDKIKSMFSVEKMMKTISQQERLADMTVIGQKGQIKEALAMLRKTTVYQRNQVNTVGRRFPAPSDEVCKDTTVKVRINETERFAEFETSIYRERDRVKNGMTVRTGQYSTSGGGAASSSLFGPTVRARALRESIAGICYDDENLGNHGSGCYYSSSSANSTAYVNFVKNPSNLIGPITAENYNPGFNIMSEMLLPPVATQRFPESIVTDTTVQDAYMMSIKNAAGQNLDEEIIRQFIANITTYSRYGFDENDITSCQKNQEFVKEVVSRKYGLRDARPGGQNACPSTAEMKWAEVMSTANTGYIAAAGGSPEGNAHQAHLSAVTLDHRLAFEETDKYRTMLLQRVIQNTLSNVSGAGEAPADNIAR